MESKQDLHIAFAANDNYIVPTTVAIESLLQNNRKGNVHIYLLYLEGTMSREHLDFLNSLVGERGKFRPLMVTEAELDGFPETRHGKAALLRLNLPSLLPGTDKILYLDGDVIVEKDLTDLYNTEMGSNYICAAKDTTPIYHAALLKKLGIGAGHWYFNSGVTLLNLKMLRSISLKDKVGYFVEHFYDSITSPDQDALNYICQGHTLYFHPQYNMNYNVEKDVALATWGKKELEEAMKEPAIIHYIGPIKPWSALSIHPRRKRWWVYLKSTPFANFRPKDYSRTNVLKRQWLRLSKGIEHLFTLKQKQAIGRLIPKGLKRRIKTSMLKSSE